MRDGDQGGWIAPDMIVSGGRADDVAKRCCQLWQLHACARCGSNRCFAVHACRAL